MTRRDLREDMVLEFESALGPLNELLVVRHGDDRRLLRRDERAEQRDELLAGAGAAVEGRLRYP